MADADSPLLGHILEQLTVISSTLGTVRDDVTTLKAQRRGDETLASEVREQGQRIGRLEQQSSKWEGAASAGGKVGTWIAGILASLITASLAAGIAYVVGHK